MFGFLSLDPPRSSFPPPRADQIFKHLQIIPSGHDNPLPSKPNSTTSPPLEESPYQVFYHVYKPVTKFKKSSPGEPDFRLVVIKCVPPFPSLLFPSRLIRSNTFPPLPAPPFTSQRHNPPPKPLRAQRALLQPPARPTHRKHSPPSTPPRALYPTSHLNEPQTTVHSSPSSSAPFLLERVQPF